jgi:Acetyltransferase (GNAT) domain
MKSEETLFKLREGLKEDEPFIYSTWLKSLYYDNVIFREIDKPLYFTKYSKVIEAILDNKVVQVNCCVLSESSEVIVGYVIRHFDRLHYIYVKKAWRKNGIAKLLLKDLNIERYSHITTLGKRLKPKEWKFDPFL